jgi:hypothetical protein
MTAEKLDNVKDGKLISLLKRLLKEIKQFIRSLINQKEVEIANLPDNMTLGDLSDLLAYSNSKLILPGYEVEYTTPDNMKFKTYQEASNHISQLAKSVEDVDLDNVNLDINKGQKKLITKSSEIPVNEFLHPEGFKAVKKDNNWYYHFNLNKPLTEKEIVNYWNTKDETYSINDDDGSVIDTTPRQNIKNFIEKNKEYEQSKEIIEEWKRVNNIVYNPEEIYSRGQEFSSVVGAYSSFDVNLMMQNLLQHIEDNEKAGGKFAISAFTKPVDKKIGHLEGGGGKIKFKIYPQSQDILWASNTDVYSGSVWDASEKVNKDKKSELLGVSYTKYPSLKNVNTVQPNLASIVDDLAHHHNELGIALTGNNFRLEYDEDIPYTTKKIIDGINKILDQKYGELVKPIIASTKDVNLYNTAMSIKHHFSDESYDPEDSGQTYQEWLEDNQDTGQADRILKDLKSRGVLRIKPTQTEDNLKESIESVYDKVVPEQTSDLTNNKYDVRVNVEFKPGAKVTVKGFEGEYIVNELSDTKVSDTLEPDHFYTLYPVNEFDPETNPNGQHPLFDVPHSVIKLIPNKKEYTEQALINTKIAKLKEVAKKYPRSLIRSEVKKSNISNNQELFEEDELPFQKIQNNQNDILESRQNTINRHQYQYNLKNQNEEITDNYGLIVKKKLEDLDKVENDLIRVNTQIAAKTSPQLQERKKALLQAKYRLQEQLDYLQDNQEELMFHAITQDIADIREVMNSDDFHNIESIASTIDFYSNLIFTDEQSHIGNELRNLQNDYEKLIESKVMNWLSNNDIVKEILDNVNNDKEALKKFNHIENGTEVILEKEYKDIIDKANGILKNENLPSLKSIADILKTLEYFDKLEKKSSLNATEISDYNNLNNNFIPRYEELMSIKEIKDAIDVQTLHVLPVATIQDLLVANYDLNWWDANFLGVISSNTGDTIIPELILQTFVGRLNTNQNNVINLINRLQEFENKHSGINKDIFNEKDSNGNPTGNLVNIYSQQWQNALYEKYNLRNTFRSATDFLSMSEAYKVLFEWHKQNSNIIDFTKIPEIFDIYGFNDNYKDYFKTSMAEMEEYDNYLRELLGPQYQYTIDNLKSKLEEYHTFLVTEKDSDYYEGKKLKNNIWEFLGKFQKGDNTQMQNDEIALERYFIDFADEYFIPKETLLVPEYDYETDQLVDYYENSGFYSSDFNTIKNDENLSELWEIYRDMANYIDAAYALGAKNRMSIPKIKTVYAEKIGEAIQSLKKGNILNLPKKVIGSSLSAWKDMFYSSETTDNTKNEGEIVSNYTDTSKAEIKKHIEAYTLQGMSYEEAKSKATAQVLSLYSDDISRNFTAILMAAALHNTRVDLAPLVNMLVQNYKDKNKHRKKGIAKLESFVNKTVFNQPNSISSTTNAPVTKPIKPLNMFNSIFENASSHPLIKRLNRLGRNLNDQEKSLLEELKEAKKTTNKKYIKKGVKELFKDNNDFNEIGNKNEYSVYLKSVYDDSNIYTDKNTKEKYVLDNNKNKIILGSKQDLAAFKKFNSESFYVNKTIKGKEYSFSKKNVAEKGGKPNFIYLKKDKDGKNIKITEEEFQDLFKEYIDARIDELGEQVSMKSIIEGYMKMQILKGLAFAPNSGVFNRMEGVITTDLMDATGEYWPTGNNNKSERFLGFSNLLNFLNKGLKFFGAKEMESIGKQLKIYREVIERLGGVQDRASELEKAAKQKNSLDTLRTVVFSWSVDLPEFKNQGQSALNVLQDFYVTDKNGNQHQFFDGKEFAMFDFIDDKLVLKKDEQGEVLFDVDINEFFESQEISNITSRIQNTIAHVNGNYFQYDNMKIKDHLAGRAGTIFKTWFPEHWQQRWGADQKEGEFNINVAQRKQKQGGRYTITAKSTPELLAAHLAGLWGIRAGGALTIIGAYGSMIGGTFALYMMAKTVDRKSIKLRKEFIDNLLRFIASTILETLNFPTRYLQAVPFIRSLKVDTNRFNALRDAKGLTDVQRNALRAMSIELSTALGFMAVKLAIAAFLYGDDDDKDSVQRRQYNYLQNQLTRLVGTLQMFSSPDALIDDMSRVGALHDMLDTWDGFSQVYRGIYGDEENLGKGYTSLVMKLVPLPKSVVNKEDGELIFMPSPIENYKNYDREPFIGNGNYTWIDNYARNKATDGEHNAKKEWGKFKDKVTEELTEKYKDLGLDKKVLKIVVDSEKRAILNQRDKDKDVDFKKLLDDPYSDKSQRTSIRNLRKKLRSEGLSEKEIDAIISKREK